jgi:hypothetical protein
METLGRIILPAAELTSVHISIREGNHVRLGKPNVNQKSLESSQRVIKAKPGDKHRVSRLFGRFNAPFAGVSLALVTGLAFVKGL